MNNFFEKTILELTENREKALEMISLLERLGLSEEWKLISLSLKETREKIINSLKDAVVNSNGNVDFLVAYLSAIDYLIELPQSLKQVIELNYIEKVGENK